VNHNDDDITDDLTGIKAVTTEVIEGQPRQVTVHLQSRFDGICAVTGLPYKAGDPVGSFEGDNGKLVWVRWPLTAEMRAERKDPFEGLKLDQYQARVPEVVGSTDQHVGIRALAGSGKSTVLCFTLSTHALSLGKCCALAFGRKDAARFKQLLPACIESRTIHSFGFVAIRKHFKVKQADLNKLYTILDEVCPADWLMQGWVEELVRKAKADAVVPGDKSALLETLERYDLAVEIPEEKLGAVVKYAHKVLRLCLNVKKYSVDQDDMIWLPAIMDELKLEQYDTVGVDEVQDLSTAQHIMVGKLVDLGARIIAVGDPNQSLYYFRGALSNSFDALVGMLAKSKRGLIELTMPICYRSSLAVIRKAQRLVPDIQARPGAPEGQDIEIGVPELLDTIGENDQILCRTKRPLLGMAFKLEQLGVPFYIQGGDKEAAALRFFILRHAKEHEVKPPTDDVKELVVRLKAWYEEREQAGSAGYRLAIWKDRIEAIEYLASKTEDVVSLLADIKRLFFVPADTTDRVLLSTIHASKGGQSRRVFHINPESLPHPKAESDEEKAQETNAEYVLITRAQDDIIWVNGDVMSELNMRIARAAA